MSAHEGSASQERWERDRQDLQKRIAGKGASGCGHPGCDIDDHPRRPVERVLSKPLMLSVPAGTHVHIDCPVHGRGSHVVRGSGVTL